MIWSNKSLTVSEREFSFGKITGVAIGETGRGRKEVFIPTPHGLEKISEGLNSGITVGQSKSGKPRINKGEDDNLYLILCTYAGYTRRGNGYIYVLEKDKDNCKLLDKGNGADGDAGRIGSWDDTILEVNKFPTIIRIKYSGGRKESDVLICKNKNEIICLHGRDEVNLYYDNVDEESPIHFDEDGFIRSEWQII